MTLRDPARQVIARIAPVDQRRVHWDACVRNAGSYVALTRAVSGPFTTESTAAVIQVNGTRAAC